MRIEFDPRLVSVIVPAYKCERYVSACLDSILGQTYPYVEVIVVYDPSPDSTYPILEKYKEHIILVKQKRKTCPATARNVGLKIARGLYVAFCDADDYFESTKIERQMRVVKEKAVNFTYTDVVLVDENDNVIGGKKSPEVSENTMKSFMASSFIPFSSVLVNKKLFEKAGGFDENLDTAEDFDLLLRLIWVSRNIKKTPGFLTFYRIRSDSLSRTLRIRKDLNRIRIFNKYGLGKQILLELPRRLIPDLLICLVMNQKQIVNEMIRTLSRRLDKQHSFHKRVGRKD